MTPLSLFVAGQVSHGGSDGAIAGAQVQIEGTRSESMSTTASGAYAFHDLDPGAWTVRVKRLGSPPESISTVDASWALQTAVGTRSLGMLETMACDVTGDGSVSVLDAAHILQHLRGTRPRFSVAQTCESDWFFVPASMVPQAGAAVVQEGSCAWPALELNPFLTSVGNADFEAGVFGDCDLTGG